MSASPTRHPVAMITVSYGSGEEIAGLLDTLPGASTSPVDVYIVDNKPEPGVRLLADRLGAHYLPRADNPGYGGAINAAAALLPAEVQWILISNPDIRLHAGAIDALLLAGENDPGIGAVGPRVLNDDGTVYPSARAIPSLRTGIGHALFSNLWLGNPWSRRYRAETANPGSPRNAGWLSGSCLLVRRTAFERLGGFDDGYFMYFEDVDLGWRLGQLGYRNRYEPTAIVTHGGGHSTSSRSRSMVAAHHHSARRFVGKRYPGIALWPVRLVLGIGLQARSTWATRRLQRSTAPISR